MSGPTLTILGVYRPLIPSETWQEQWNVTGDDAATNAHFAGLVLIEAIVEGLDGQFDMGKLGQMQRDFPDDLSRMMVGYDEGLLSNDGETLIQRAMDCVQGTGTLRFAVYLHDYDPARPLQWQAGEVVCPPCRRCSGPPDDAHVIQCLHLNGNQFLALSKLLSNSLLKSRPFGQ